jgi:hypothetical protein
LILESEYKLIDYETRRLKGEKIPDATMANEQRNREDLERKKEQLLDDIRAETSLYASEPALLATVRVVPGKSITDEMTSDTTIEQIGMAMAMKYEREQGRQPEDVSTHALGYDIRSVDREGNYRYIEVKARAKSGAIALTPNEWVMANRLGEEYWLYVVEQAAGNPQLYLIKNPAASLQPNEQVEIVRYVIRDWRSAAKKA